MAGIIWVMMLHMAYMAIHSKKGSRSVLRKLVVLVNIHIGLLPIIQD